MAGAAGRPRPGGGALSGPRSLILVGLPGAGKSAVAPLVAAELGAPWCDLDERIVATAGCSIPAIWAEAGEPGFRARERAAMLAVLAEPPMVIAAGGGWIAEPGNLQVAEARALILYMSLDPADAARRLAGDGGRPLLQGEGDLTQRLCRLLAVREPWYRLAAVEVAVGTKTPAEAAEAIAQAARRHAGW